MAGDKEQTEGVLTGVHETSHNTYGSEEIHVLLGQRRVESCIATDTRIATWVDGWQRRKWPVPK